MNNPKARLPRASALLALTIASLLLLTTMTTMHSQAKSSASGVPRLLMSKGYATPSGAAATRSPLAELLPLEDQSHLSKPIVSPDGRFAAITAVPLGTETAYYARTYLVDLTSRTVHATIRGYTPRWLDNGTRLQLETIDRGLALHALADLLSPGGAAVDPIEEPLPSAMLIPSEPMVAAAALRTAAYPATIRVAHHPSNGCRDLPDWQIDTIPFEEYVARVVPAETPAWWPVDALAAQAVAARTYAWYKILANRPDYDVTDWANYQMMCDTRTANSDTAAAMTQGQYLTSIDDSSRTPIAAMYSAENGHPTLTNPNVTYLQSVPDRFALGRERWGHGYGLSQWGAYRRANAGQSYRQILGHYYRNVYLQNGLTPETSIAVWFGADPPYQTATDSVALAAMYAATADVHYRIAAGAGLTAPVTISPMAATDSMMIWRAPSALPEATWITASLWIGDQVQETIRWQVDHQPPPTPALAVPEMITTPIVTLTLPADTGLPLLSAGWQWPGATLHHTANSGAAVGDNATPTGIAWQADPDVHDAGVWYGPYTDVLPAGHSYRAIFWLRAMIALSTTTSHQPIARLDVADDEGRRLLGLRDLTAADFRDNTSYHPIAVDFHLFDAPKGVEFRVAWAGRVGLALDRVEVWQLPDALIKSDNTNNVEQNAVQTTTTAQFIWPVVHPSVLTVANSYTRTLFVRATDDTGNLSPVADYALSIADNRAPTFGQTMEPPGWVAGPEVTVT
ncbi:MAG: hypothetical protein KDE31_30115, partial [Caldilineaceae bacterium]|nr:hypothetical protein [Caldilineaceae bacterium]